MIYRLNQLAGLGLITLTACAGSGNHAELGRLQRRLERLTQRYAERERDLESLSNRVFLLEDKVDTSRVANKRRAPLRLPVVRIGPDGNDLGSPHPGGASPSPTASSGTVDPEAGGGRSIVSRESVDYDGAARLAVGGPRPVLRLHEPGGLAGDGGVNAATANSGTPSSGAKGRSAPPRAGALRIDPSRLEERLPVVPIPRRTVAVAIAKSAPSLEAMRAYTAALGLYRAGKHPEAVRAFRAFIKRHAKHAYADNALYWLGECHYDSHNFRGALKAFRAVVERYPGGNKAPAALLKMGFSYMKLDEKHNAKTVLAQVVDIFPRTQVARLASQTLSKLR